MELRLSRLNFIKMAITYVLLAVMCFLVYFPFYWIVCSSLKTFAQMHDMTRLFWPSPFSLENYQTLLRETEFISWFKNSFLVSTVSTAISVTLGCLGAYSLVRLRYPGRAFFSSSILCVYLIPASILFIPLYMVLKPFGLINTRLSLIATYPTFSIPLVTWLLMGFFRSIPMELDEAALIDGCTRLESFWKIIIPLTGPGITAVGIFAYTFSWNEYLYALIFIQDDRLKTLSVGIAQLIMGDVYLWGQLMAAATLTTLPIVLIYGWMHRYMVEGLTSGSVKG